MEWRDRVIEMKRERERERGYKRGNKGIERCERTINETDSSLCFISRNVINIQLIGIMTKKSKLIGSLLIFQENIFCLVWILNLRYLAF